MHLIDDQTQLDEVLPHLDYGGRIAIDTEADSMHCYFEKLCLIQLSVPGHDLLIDPLAPLSFQAFYEDLAMREIILHGADYDLRLMGRVGFPEPSKVFDTMIAARLTGRREFSLSALINEFFDVQLAKGSQKADWSRRPLSEKMREYAINDTRYLLELARRLEEELESLGRLDWHAQSCVKAIAQAQISKERDPEKIWRIAGSSKLNGRASAILRELWRWRDGEAREADRPAFHILHNEQLLESAARLADGQSIDFPRMPSSRLRRFRVAIDAAIEVDELDWPRPERKPRLRASNEQVDRLQRLKSHRDRVAKELALDPSLIAPKAALERLAFEPEDGQEKLLPWQRALMEF